MSSQKNLRNVFSAAPKVSGPANAFPKQVLKSKAAAASETTRSTRDGTTKCCSIGNCPGESLEVGGTVSVVVLQEDEKPMCVRTIAGCAPLQRPTEDQACLYDGSSLINTELIGGSYSLLCVPDESETLVCVSNIDFYVVYAGGSGIPTSTVLGNIVLNLNSDANKQNLSIKVANVTDLILLVGSGNVNSVVGGVSSEACLSTLPSGEESFSTAIFRLNLAQVFGAGFTIAPKDSIVVNYSFANPSALYPETIKSIFIKVRGAVQDKTCGLGFAPIKTTFFIDSLKIITLPPSEGGDRENQITFCLLDCQDGKVTNEPLTIRFTATDFLSVLTIPNLLPTEVGKNCYATTFALTPNKKYILNILTSECVIYKSEAFSPGIILS